jgi:hypothetical protein
MPSFPAEHTMAGFKRRLKNASKGALNQMFVQMQRLGFDVLPRHFYSEIPVIRALRTSTEWKRRFSMNSVRGREIEGQVAFARSCCLPEIVKGIDAKNVYSEACKRNGEIGFGPMEAEFLFAFVASQKPAQIFQIGSGVSTAVCQLAAEFAGYCPEIICVEPYPTQFLVQESAAGRIRLIKEKAQSVKWDVIDALGSNLLFFVDSTHTLGPAGEVSRIILEMLPRLKPGARAHFHDITFPYDYGRDLLNGALFFWHESVLLHAFLAGNARFRILAALSMLHYDAPNVLRDLLPHYQPASNDEGLNVGEGHFPCSAYLQVD